MTEYPPCPKCKCEYTYPSDNLIVCPECFHEWEPTVLADEIDDFTTKILDSNGIELQKGDSVVIIKDLAVKGFQKSIKSGTKVRNIRLVDSTDGHNIDCKIEDFGAMVIKSEFVRKV
jgi:protein PhnA